MDDSAIDGIGVGNGVGIGVLSTRLSCARHNGEVLNSD